LSGLLSLATLSPGVACAEDAALPAIYPAGIHGKLLLCGGGAFPASIKDRFVELAGGATGKLVVIPTAAEQDDQIHPERLIRFWKAAGIGEVSVLHTRNREQVENPEFIAPLTTASAVWFDGGSQQRIADAYLGTAVERELFALLRRDGIIGGTSAGAAIQCRTMIAQGNPVAVMSTGFDFLPGAIIDQHFTQRKREPRLWGALEQHPGHWGLGLDEGTAVLVQERTLTVLGEHQARLFFSAGNDRPQREVVLKPGSVSDLTMWRKTAAARATTAFPPAELSAPEVPQGSLFIVGGGGMTKEMIERFIALAGGPESPIVVLPTAAPGTAAEEEQQGDFLRKAGATQVKVLHQSTQEGVSSPEFLDAVRSARGVWFGGGRQWRFVDAYEQSPAVAAFHDVLKQGGVIGGSSAGATIQGEYLSRGSPLGNTEMMCEGYERGFAFLPGTVIDQHFTQRNRQPDLARVINRFPMLLGIGLDETTAIVVQGSTAEVVGRHAAHFYDRRRPVRLEDSEYVSLKAGGRYDLVRRLVATPTGQ